MYPALLADRDRWQPPEFDSTTPPPIFDSILRVPLRVRRLVCCHTLPRYAATRSEQREASRLFVALPIHSPQQHQTKDAAAKGDRAEGERGGREQQEPYRCDLRIYVRRPGKLLMDCCVRSSSSGHSVVALLSAAHGTIPHASRTTMTRTRRPRTQHKLPQRIIHLSQFIYVCNSTALCWREYICSSWAFRLSLR